MRIKKIEKIFLTTEEADTWEKFSQMIEEIKRESDNSNILNFVDEIIDNMADLWEEIAEVE